ncbi:MAG: hypothetical protein WBS19_19875 [Candidatus Korobacteraceae bacterium]
MSESQPTHFDADLILKLYDLRREPVMREARTFLGKFSPKSVDDLMKVASGFGTQDQTYLRQVVGYWEMAASLVNRGALNRELALDNFQEMFFVYAKVQPYLEEFRQKMGMPQFMRQAQQLAESSAETRERTVAMQKTQAEMARRSQEASLAAR